MYYRVANRIFKKKSEKFHTFQEHMNDQDEVIFSHNWEIQTGGIATRNCCNLRSCLSKILNSRISLKKWPFSSTFPVPKKIQNRFDHPGISL